MAGMRLPACLLVTVLVLGQNAEPLQLRPHKLRPQELQPQELRPQQLLPQQASQEVPQQPPAQQPPSRQPSPRQLPPQKSRKQRPRRNVSSPRRSRDHPVVLSNLQYNSTESSELPPYPVGAELALTCQVTGRKTYWLEGRENLPCIRSEPFPGLGVCTYSVERLRLEDDGRILACMMDSSIAREDVTLRVVGPPTLKVGFSDGNFEQQLPGTGFREEIDLSREKEATFKCETAEMSPYLKLCWFRDDKLVTCEGNASEASVSMSVNVADTPGNLHLACKPQFRDKMFATLKRKVRQQFEEMFDRVQLKYEVHITENDEPVDTAPSTQKPLPSPGTTAAQITATFSGTTVISNEKTQKPSPETTPLYSTVVRQTKQEPSSTVNFSSTTTSTTKISKNINIKTTPRVPDSSTSTYVTDEPAFSTSITIIIVAVSVSTSVALLIGLIVVFCRFSKLKSAICNQRPRPCVSAGTASFTFSSPQSNSSRVDQAVQEPLVPVTAADSHANS